MARKPRIEFEGAFYHIIIRGNQRQKIFKDKYDFLKYLEILSYYKKRYNFFLYSYVLMSNHAHLLIETQEIALSKILQGINQRFTMYFNKRYRTVGHLFQGRYKAILCDRDRYLLALIKYIHNNPVRARIVKKTEEYKWSSHNEYAKKTNRDDIVDADKVLRMFSEDKTEARRLYREFVCDGIAIKKEDIYSTIDQRILGDEEFAEEVVERYEVNVKEGKRNREYTLGEISRGVEKICRVTLKQIRQKSKSEEISTAKKLLSLVANEYGYKGREIAEFIQKDPAVVTRYLKEKTVFTKEIVKVIKVMKN